MGLTWLKMDLGVEMVADTPGTVTNANRHHSNGEPISCPIRFSEWK